MRGQRGALHRDETQCSFLVNPYCLTVFRRLGRGGRVRGLRWSSRRLFHSCRWTHRLSSGSVTLLKTPVALVLTHLFPFLAGVDAPPWQSLLVWAVPGRADDRHYPPANSRPSLAWLIHIRVPSTSP